MKDSMKYLILFAASLIPLTISIVCTVAFGSFEEQLLPFGTQNWYGPSDYTLFGVLFSVPWLIFVMGWVAPKVLKVEKQ